MKPIRPWLLVAPLLLASSLLAQNYHAGTGSGNGGDQNVFVGPYAGRITYSLYNSFLGFGAGYSNTSGYSNSFLGNSAGFSNTTGYQNSFLGESAGFSNTTGGNNCFLGAGAGYNNTTGGNNSFMGNDAGINNKSGYGNTFLGGYAGQSNSVGNFNSYVGQSAGLDNSTGSGNSFLGSQAGAYNFSSYNSFLGVQAGFYNESGMSNTFLGAYAAYYNSLGSRNVVVGDSAAYFAGGGGSFNVYIGSEAGRGKGQYDLSNSGNDNAFVGSQAGYANTTGSSNSFLGYRAGYANTTGAGNAFVGSQSGFSNSEGFANAFLGHQAGYLNTTGKHNSFVGYQAGYTNDTGYDNLFLGYQSGNKNTVGYANAFVGAYAGFANTSGYSNTCFGSNAGFALTTSARNSFFGNFAGRNTTSGSENVFLGRNAGEKNVNGYFNTSLGNFAGPSIANLQNAAAIGYRSSVSASNCLVLGSIYRVNGAVSNTNVGIGTTAPAYQLHVNGTAAKPGGGSWTVASDQRLKRDVIEFKDGLALIEKIRPVWFRYNGKAGLPTDKQYVGVIAQEMQKIAPYTVGEFVYQDTTGKQEQYLDYDANAVTYMLVNAVKEVDHKYAQQLKEKDAQLSSQQQQIGALTERLLQLEALLNLGSKAASVEAPTSGGAQLWQNEPNPADGTTVIRYYLPLETTSAHLKLYSLTGVEVESIPLPQKGHGQVRLSVGRLAAGEYVYHLLVDGRSIASKKLLLQK